MLGAGGLLGKEISRRWPGVSALPKKACDITDRSKLMTVVSAHKPDVIINCAAITNIEICESDPLPSWEVNVVGVRNIAEAARRTGSYVVHFSSDYAVYPVNEYGWTKFASESLVPGLVMRCSFYNESHWLFRALSAGKTVDLLNTNQFNPITIGNLLNYMEQLINIEYKGVINIGVRNAASYFDFGCALCKIFGFDRKLVRPIASIDVQYTRPTNTFLALDDLKGLGFKILSLEQDIGHLKNETKKETNTHRKSSSR